MHGEPVRLTGDWPAPARIRFGAERIAELPESCVALGLRRPLLVTDAGLSGSAVVREALALNEAAGLPTVRKAAADGCAPTNPVPVDAVALERIFRDALRGTLRQESQ